MQKLRINSSQWVTLLACILLATGSVIARGDRDGERDRGGGIYGGDAPVVKAMAVLDGSLHQIKVDSIRTVEDSVFFNPALTGQVDTGYMVQNVVTLKINEASTIYLRNTFTVSVRMLISYTSGTGDTASLVRTFTVNYDSAHSYNSRSTFAFSGAHKVSVKVLSIDAGSTVSWDPTTALVIENQMMTRPAFKFSCSNTITGIAITPVADTADELPVSWNAVFGADQYDLEWAYIDTNALRRNRYGSPLDLDRVFRNNASRVTISGTSYTIPLIYEDSGTVFVRVRPVQIKAGFSVVSALWSTQGTTPVYGRYSFIGHERPMNWESEINYAEDGKRKVVVEYMDGVMHGRQSVIKDPTANTLVIRETYYDYQGRPAIEVMPSPSLASVIRYTGGFNVAGNGAEYTQANYDSLADPGSFCSIHADSMSVRAGASRYYSSNNPAVKDGINQFTPDAHNYPFVETEYTPDNSLRISRKSALGIDFQLGSGHELKYYYGTPDQHELDALFGTEVGDKSHYLKDMIRDANGQYSVVYKDMHGRTIATALAGAAPSGIAPLASNSSRTLTETLVDSASTFRQDLSMMSQKNIMVPVAENYSFSYNLTPGKYNEANCQNQNICYTCRYDLEVSITDNCNNQLLPGHKPYDTVLHNFNPLAAYNDSCLNTPIALNFTLFLQEGSYTITKKLSVNKDYYNWYRDSIFTAANTCRTQQQFIDSMKAINAAYNPSCAPDCGACRTAVGTWDQFWTKYKASGGLGNGDTAAYQSEAMTAYKNALSACNALCGDSLTEDDDILNAMLQDVTPPFGQYADSSLAANSDKYSIFYIPPGDTADYVPVFQLQNLQYLDGNGRPDSVYNSSADLMVNPNTLTMDQFVQNFRSSWAYALLPYHPEYCKLKALQAQKPSSMWDKRFQAIDSYSAAAAGGYLNPTGSGAAPFNHFTPVSANVDPLMSNSQIRTDVENKMKVYQAAQGSNPPLSMWAVACLMVKCGSSDLACVVTYSNINNDFSASMCPGDLDMAWKNFRQLYLDVKHDYLYKDLLNKPAGCTPTNSQAYPSTPSAEDLYTAYHTPEFSDDQTRLNRSSLQDYLKVGGQTQANTLADKNQASIDSFYTSNCRAYATQWTQQLSHCVYYSQTALTDTLLPWLTGLCRKACDTAHPYGASSLPTGVTYTPAGTSYSFHSFQDIINTYNSLRGITDAVDCNAELLVSPQPYDNQPIYSNKPIYSKPSDCECTMIKGLHTSFVLHPQGYASFSLYLKNRLQVNLTDAELNQLLAMCNNTSTPGCTFLPQPIMLPPAMQCNSGSTCASCAMVASVYQNYLSTYPGNAPAATLNVDTLQAKKNLLFQNYMNNRLGYNMQVSDYLQFMDSCNNYVNNGGGSGTGGNPGAHISCDSLTKIRKWFYDRYPISQGDVLTASQLVPVKKVVHITQPFQNEFDDDGNLVWFADTTYGTTASNSIAGLGAATWTNGAWYKYRDNIVFDFSKLPNNVAVTAASMNLYAKDSALELYTGHGAHFRRIADPFYGIFQRALSPVIPGVTTWSSQPSVSTSNSVTIPTISIPNAYMTTHPSSVQIYSNQDYTGVNATGLARDMYQASLNNADYGMMFRLSNDTLGTYAMYMFWAGLASTPAGKNPNMNLTFTVSRGDLFTWFVDSVLKETYTSSQVDSLYQDACGTSSGQYGGLEGPLLCGKSSPVFPPMGTDSVTNCTDSVFFSVSMGTALYNAYVDSLKGDFEKKYLAKCLDAYKLESFTMTHSQNEYNFALYYYDQAGNLVKTIPTAGVMMNTDSAWLDSVRVARTQGRVIVPNHTMLTQYRYNSMDYVTAQRSPDGGMIRLWYDRMARKVLSQDGRQRQNNEYSYTLFDSLNRIVQVGQLTSSTLMTDDISRVDASLTQWIQNAISTAVQIRVTHYDSTTSAILPEMSPRNLRNTVSWVAMYNTYADMTASPALQASAQYYSYDVLGNIDTLVQDFKLGSMASHGNRFKKIAYNFDQIGGKVNRIAYQSGYYDAFHHVYQYDALNQLTNVQTSTDSINWDNDAFYQYYNDGSLGRTVLGQQQVQGINFAYTLQGWLKAINPAPYTGAGYTLRPDSAGTIVAANAYNMILNYFNGDYNPISGAPGPDQGVSTTLGIANYRPLYNGNISSIGMSIRKLNTPLLYNYQYDQLNRMVGMDAWKRTGSDWSSISAISDYKESIVYDPNGNILKYRRNGNTADGLDMDKMSYNYIAGTNKLDHIQDTVPGSAYPADIDDQAINNYRYDSSGQLIYDAASGIRNIAWTSFRKIASMSKDGDTTLLYSYDARGFRISKSVIHLGDTVTTWYVRDANGRVLSVYTYGDPAVHGKDLTQTELNIYGSSRLGILKPNKDVALDQPVTTVPMSLLGIGDSLAFTRGNKFFELTNHIGNVISTLSDKRFGVSLDDSLVSYFIPDVVSAQDYYPFGSQQAGRSYTQLGSGYRYGFGGKEKDDEVKGPGNQLDFGERAYDPRVGRWLSSDPYAARYMQNSPYSYALDNPIAFVDPGGDTTIIHVHAKQVGTTTINLCSADEIKKDAGLKAYTQIEPVYQVDITNQSGCTATFYFTRDAHRQQLNPCEKKETTFDVRKDGDKFLGVVKNRWGKKDYVLELRKYTKVTDQSIEGTRVMVDEVRTAIQMHLKGASDGCLLCVGSKQFITIEPGATLNLGYSYPDSKSTQLNFMKTVKEFRAEDKAEGHSEVIVVVFDKLFPKSTPPPSQAPPAAPANQQPAIGPLKNRTWSNPDDEKWKNILLGKDVNLPSPKPSDRPPGSPPGCFIN